ncbi:MAG: DUF4185 domain-containing protein [Deltaproteobacteria bacterium]|nr:DUF4185 domain-containing protein [Deltaproteobacteria bacterium]
MRTRLALAVLVLAACSRGPAGKVAKVEELGALQQSPLIVGRDGAETARVWGQEVWAFGDTFLSVPNAQGFNFVSNTFSISATAVIDGGLALADRLDDAGAPLSLFQPTSDELAVDLAHQQLPDGGCLETPCGQRWATWPGAIVFDADAGTALAFYGLVTAAPGDFNFQGVGQSMAMWSSFDALPTRPAFNVCADQPMALFCQDEPSFGSAAVEQDGFIFAFGCNKRGFNWPCKLARVPFAQAQQRSAWQFWNGSDWSSKLGDAAEVFDGASILNVSFNAHLGQWLVVYSAPLSNDVKYRTAPKLTGEWSGEATLFTTDRQDAGGTSYDALLHSELSEDDGRILYVTFSRPTPGWFNSEFALVRITLE